jgi:PAS domain S-box-containing protein
MMRIKKLESEYGSIFENTGTATIIVDEDRIISEANTEFEKLSGYSKKEIEGKKKWTEFVAEDYLDKMRKYHKLRIDIPIQLQGTMNLYLKTKITT